MGVVGSQSKQLSTLRSTLLTSAPQTERLPLTKQTSAASFSQMSTLGSDSHRSPLRGPFILGARIHLHVGPPNSPSGHCLSANFPGPELFLTFDDLKVLPKRSKLEEWVRTVLGNSVKHLWADTNQHQLGCWMTRDPSKRFCIKLIIKCLQSKSHASSEVLISFQVLL